MKTEENPVKFVRFIPSGTFFTWLNQFLKRRQKSFPGSGKIKSSNEELYKLKKNWMIPMLMITKNY